MRSSSLPPNGKVPGAGPSLPAVQWQASKPLRQFDLLLLGDTAFGANYQEKAAAKGRRNILEEFGYDHGFEHVDPILHDADLVLANLETPLTERRSSPFEDIRPYIHYDDPDKSVEHLRAHNIQAVTLANNHSHDMGEPGLRDTIDTLNSRSMLAIGAGLTLREARRPLQVRAGIDGGAPFHASIFARFRGGREFEEVLKAHATSTRPGSAPFKTAEAVRTVANLREQSPEEFIVMLPHWRRDYKWSSNGQRSAAERLVDAGVNLVVGHGSHMAQEIDFLRGRLVLNGIGNFIFNSAGRYRRMGVPPYSMIVRLTVDADNISVRIYPIHTNNRKTNYQPHPVRRDQFEDFYNEALTRTNDAHTFLSVVEPAEDQYGHHLAVPLDRHGRIQGPDSRGAGDASARWGSGRREVELNQRDNISSQLIEYELRERGAAVQRLSTSAITGRLDGTKFLYHGSTSHRSALPSARATRRRKIARKLLNAAGVSIARGAYFRAASELPHALEFAGSGGTVVVTPVGGTRDATVNTGLSTKAEIIAAWEQAFAESARGVLIEKYFAGPKARFLVVGGECEAVAQRIPLFVTGNGTGTIRDLVLEKNRQRWEIPHLRERPVILDPALLERLHRNGMSPLTVLGGGDRLDLDYGDRHSTAAEDADITDTVHPSYREIARRAAQAFPGLDLAGVDIVAQDFSRPASSTNHIVSAVKGQPRIGPHHFPSTGHARNVAGAFVDHTLKPRTAALLPRPDRPQSPSTGRRDANASLLARELQSRGLTVRWWSHHFLTARQDEIEVSVWGSTTHRTSQAAVAVSRRPRTARTLLKSAGVPLPPGRVFVADQATDARRFVQKLGSATARVGDRPPSNISGNSADHFQSVWDRISTSQRQVLIEHRPQGDELRFLVSHGHVLSVLEAVDDGTFADATDRIHATYHDSATLAALAFPGLDLTEVTLIVRRVSKPANKRNHVVTLVRSGPDLANHMTKDHVSEGDPVRTIVDHLLETPPTPHVRPYPAEGRPTRALARLLQRSKGLATLPRRVDRSGKRVLGRTRRRR